MENLLTSSPALQQPNKNMPLGFYVHTHGYGHAMRANVLARNFTRPVTFLSSFPQKWQDFPENVEYISLPNEDLESPVFQQPERPPGHFHYLPLGVKNVSERIARISEWIHRSNPLAVVVDVSVEIAQLCRICSVPVIVPRMHGNRTDNAHLAAYEAASLLFAPFPEWAEQDNTPEWVKEKTIYLGAICKFNGATEIPESAFSRPYTLIMMGGAKDELPLSKVIKWAEHFPEMDWIIIGNAEYDEITDILPGNLAIKEYVTNPEYYLKHAEYVIAPCSDNIASEIAFFGKKWITIPVERPFEEQVCKADIFDRENVAVLSDKWPGASKLRFLLKKAEAVNIEKQKSLINSFAASQFTSKVEDYFASILV